MTNSEELLKCISESGITITAIASKMGITRECLYRKLRNETEFKASEIVAMQDILRISSQKRDEIFFESNVE